MHEMNPAWVEMEQILVEARDDWRRKRPDYDDAFELLGSKGQFSDIWRKVAKLKRSIWDEIPLKGEQPEQIAKEIIPHCLILIYLLREEALPASEQATQIIKP